MEQSDTFPIQCRHIEHVHEGVWFVKTFFDKTTAVRHFFPDLYVLGDDALIS